MAEPIVWKNVAVSMQSAIAAAKTISGITKASPPVVTSDAHGYANGDIVFLEVLGMYQLNEKVARVANIATDTFELEGLDSTEFDTFSSGTAQEVTLGTSVTSATTINGSGGEFDFVDTTTIHANAKSQIPGLPSAISYSMDNIWDISDAGEAAMLVASNNQSRRVIKFQFGPGGRIMYFAGYVGFTGIPTGQAQGLVTSPAVFTINVAPTYYSS